MRTAERSYRRGTTEIMVRPELVRKYALTEGAAVCGQTERKKGKRALTTIETLGGLPPEKFAERQHFSDLVAIDPYERFDLGSCGQERVCASWT